MPSLSVLAPIAAALTLAAPPSSPGDVPAATAPRNDSIRQRDIKADLFFLAGDRFKGRLTASPENDMACEFIASRFQRLGLKPLGTDGSYYQRFNLVTASLGTASSLISHLEMNLGGLTGIPPLGMRHTSGQGFIPLRFGVGGTATVVGDLLFVGFGISAHEKGHDDYEGIDAKDHIVLVLDHEPGEHDPESPFEGVIMSEAAIRWRKALTAQEKGAVGILFVSDAHNHPGPENFEAVVRSTWPDKPPRLPRYFLQDWVDRIHIPAAQISVTLARGLLEEGAKEKRLVEKPARAESKRSLEELARAAERSHKKDVSGATVLLTTDILRHIVPDRNVLAAVEGSDPKLKDQWVIISCHLDHDGADGGRIYNGADDNASGTVGLLEIAEAYALAAEEGHRPRRSVLFAAFNSEERGLLGSWAFVERPPVPLDRIVAVLNMDMIGRDEEVPEGGGRRFHGLPVQSAGSNHNAVNLLGYSRCPALAELVERADAPFGLKLKKVLDDNVSQLLRRSDQWPFLQKGVPALFFHTGLHPDYHTPADRPEKINYPKMERIVRLVHQASWDLAQGMERPKLDAKPAANARKHEK